MRTIIKTAKGWYIQPSKEKALGSSTVLEAQGVIGGFIGVGKIMKRPKILYQCGDCGMEYQVVDGIEVINRFAWVPWDERGERKCKRCCSEAMDKMDGLDHQLNVNI